MADPTGAVLAGPASGGAIAGGPATAVDEDLARTAVDLALALRAEGVTVTPDATTTFTAALHLVRPAEPAEVYWAARSTLVHRPEDAEAFDRAFGRVLGGDGSPPADADADRLNPAGPERDAAGPGPDQRAGARPAPATGDPHHADEEADQGPRGRATGEPDRRSDGSPGDPAAERRGEAGTDDGLTHADADAGDRIERVVWSAVEVLRRRDLATCTPEELAEAHRLIAELRVPTSHRRSRRRRPTHHHRGTLDLERTVRRAIRTGGEVTRPARAARSTRPRRLVLLLDVSGSMEPYARSLVRFAHAGVAARRRGAVEVFTLGTRVTRITRELSSHDPDEALRRASAAIADWSGGTRLGAGLREFNDRWGTRGLGRGAVVVVLSDGWDRGDPDLLGAEVARLHRVTHRLVWVNPLKATDGYEPRARGMAAALPHLDDFVEGHSVRALEALARLVAGTDNRQHLG